MTEAIRLGRGAPRRTAWRAGWALFAGVLGGHALIALAVGEVAWDDGYITLAFARTFAETGHIGLTPASEIVEGATSPAWFLLMAAVYKLGVTSFYGFHLASQLAAAVCAAVTAVLLYRLLAPTVPGVAWWIALLTLFLGPFRTETANGMEMTLLCVVVLGMISLLRDDRRQPVLGLVALAAVVPLVRLEAAGYVVAGAIALAVLSRQVRVAAAVIAGTVASVLLVSYVRLLVFGTFGLTNTMLAKQLSPYSPPFGTPAWNTQILVSLVIEPVTTLLPPLVVAVVLARMSAKAGPGRPTRTVGGLLAAARLRHLPARVSFGVGYAAAFLGFVIVFGSNYFAPPGRMGASATLALIVAAGTVFPVPRSQPPLPIAGRVIAIGVLVVMPFTGLVSQDTGWLYLARINADEKLSFNSSIAYRKNGEAAERVRELLAQPTVSVLLADVGAPSLCCQRLEILDLGLLANAELATHGWTRFPEYLRTNRPDLIQTHGVWSQESGIYANAQFLADYTPVVVGESLFFMRDDLLDRLAARCTPADLSGPYFYAGLEPASSKPGSNATTIDRDFLESLGAESLCRLD